ncbi:DUF1934 domain-containing protein [Paenibacillus sp. ACRRX]|uniref:DUF1934 domain-containing protein n=1 Tax=unclassified Paenibacillus TaxID=185978 RepID=UPI001EF4F5FB|nr:MULTISPECIES: DUF1934 domain-containing protein [unclassified Paenibacillus]MCG7410720.1 DUF1934 domain-containing protein [Paenibacillus sp. ACRRX]MDK8184017.1 DUF1934 domain-containing protein [Paenibacillus sp. UMB4589-SE434]
MIGQRSDKQRVRIHVTSRQQHECVELHVDGDLYHKGNSIYIRYIEPAPEENQAKRQGGSSQPSALLTDTTVMLKLSAKEWKLSRRGNVQSEMSFAMERSLQGTYISEVLRFPLETRTRRMERRDEPIRLSDGSETLFPSYISWSYDLYIEEKCTGQFEIEMRLEPAHEN